MYFTGWPYSGQRRFNFLQHPLVAGSIQMAVVPVETALKDVLEQAGTLPAHDGVAGNGLEISIRRAGRENLDLPLTLRIGCVTMRINFRGQVIQTIASFR